MAKKKKKNPFKRVSTRVMGAGTRTILVYVEMGQSPHLLNKIGAREKVLAPWRSVSAYIIYLNVLKYL